MTVLKLTKAKLKQDRLDSLAAADARVVQVIAEFTDRISEAIIADNKAMHTRHAVLLAVPVNAKLFLMKSDNIVLSDISSTTFFPLISTLTFAIIIPLNNNTGLLHN